MGYYDPEKIEKSVPGSQHVFQSNVTRGIADELRLIKAQFNPAPGSYDKNDGFDVVYKDKDQATRQFMANMPKKIVPVNLYDPHAEPELD